jgi:hypothetical protein
VRPRAAVLASLVAALGFAALPAAAVAAPHHYHGLTIDATPNPIISGDGVFIHGRLNVNGTHASGQMIVLYHRINPSPVFTVISKTLTEAGGYYEFTRAEGVVLTNRNWFVRAPGLPGNIHSRTLHERVQAEVSLTAPTPAAPATAFLTNKQVVFTGTVAPDHARSQVLLQEQVGAAGSLWRIVARGLLNSASQFAIPTRFKVPGDHTMRVLFPGDRRNVAAASQPVEVTVQQKEISSFTISSSAPIVTDGTSATISGLLTKGKAPATPESGVTVTLYGHTAGQPFAPIASMVTGTDGSYSFIVTPTQNTEYQVRAANRQSSPLFEGVGELVTINASSNASAVGQSVTFTGLVTPDKAGHQIDLERLDADGSYQVVATGTVSASSTYQIVWTFGNPGNKTFRVFVPGGPDNVGGVSSTEAVNVSLPALTTLPTGS